MRRLVFGTGVLMLLGGCTGGGTSDSSYSPVPELMELATSPDAGDRLAGFRAMRNYKNHLPELRPIMVKGMTDSDTLVSYTAAEALSLLDPDAREPIPRLIAALNEPNLGVFAAKLLWGRGAEESKQAVAALRRMLKDPDMGKSSHAAQVLSTFGPEAWDAIPEIVELYAKDNHSARFASALGGFGAEARAAIPALIEAVRTKKGDDLEYAVLALGEIGPEARDAVPALIEALEDPDPAVHRDREELIRQLAREAIEKIGQPAEKPELPAERAEPGPK